MWKKQNEIKGVSDSTLVDLRATLFDKEQQHKRLRQGQEERKRVKRVRQSVKADTLGKPNRGVQDRAFKDEAEKSGMTVTEAQERLKFKAEVYNRVRKAPDGSGTFLVDFEAKRWQNEGSDEDPYDAYERAEQEREARRREKLTSISALATMEPEKRARIANATMPANWKTVEAYRDEAEYERARDEKRRTIEVLAEQTRAGRERHRKAKRRR
eukprot:CAMPEP_0119127056 /NCGR_PEP_ID=MMETSP1310-20130426/5746_1 /TAXON_ID=464262 /ORGANISM="Genus nov. species nov., Strain RCC2339" /LENGTH=212 /DNA_ID=CAMNT_0007117277 /DNA_START=162 /DNA_END=796 /DNA_ORIENTATION=-